MGIGFTRIMARSSLNPAYKIGDYSVASYMGCGFIGLMMTYKLKENIVKKPLKHFLIQRITTIHRPPLIVKKK